MRGRAGGRWMVERESRVVYGRAGLGASESGVVREAEQSGVRRRAEL